MDAVQKTSQRTFLDALAEYGNVKAAARMANLDRGLLYRWRKRDPAFAEAWEEAAVLGAAALEDEARRRACEGWEMPVWHRGEQCGTMRRYSDALLVVLLKAHMPEKYAERHKPESASSGRPAIQWQQD